ncbi:MAG: GNAT family N-acetyltransferase [Agarilytica sp.]
MLLQPKYENHQSTVKQTYTTVAARGPMLDRVYSMRYRSYSEEGYIEKNTSEKFMDEYDAQSNCTSHLLYYGDKAVASIRTCLYDPQEDLDVPIMDVYAKEIEENIPSNSAFIEVNKFVVDPSFQQKGGLQARFQLFYLMTEQCLDQGATSILIAVRPEHVRFYKMLKCYAISESKQYPHLNFDTVLLACTEVKKAQAFISRKLGFGKVGNESVSNYRVN